MTAPVGVDIGQAVTSTAAGHRTGRFALFEQLLADDIRFILSA
ncbi:MAG: hypothetical protein ACRDQ6_02520 [Pseudonocardiaceae bacterium]